jgi:hypothetical protein
MALMIGGIWLSSGLQLASCRYFLSLTALSEDATLSGGCLRCCCTDSPPIPLSPNGFGRAADAASVGSPFAKRGMWHGGRVVINWELAIITVLSRYGVWKNGRLMPNGREILIHCSSILNRKP